MNSTDKENTGTKTHPSDICMKQTDDLVNLFSTTLRSLSADATAVQQVSSLVSCLSENQNDKSKDIVNGTSNIDVSTNQPFVESLRELDDLVLGLEEKVSALRQMVREESRSMKIFETRLKEEAEDQAQKVQHLLDALDEHEKENQSLPGIRGHHDDDDDDEADDNNIENNNGLLDQSNKQGLSSFRKPMRRDSMDPRVPIASQSSQSEGLSSNDSIVLPRITRSELDHYKSQNLQAPRISLMDLNEALEEIEQVARVQWHSAQILRRKQLLATGTKPSNSMQRRLEYLQQRHHVSNNESITHISEQDLRENCAFFGRGESTARATLSLLCSLRRLKQIPGKHRKFMYQLLVS